MDPTNEAGMPPESGDEEVLTLEEQVEQVEEAADEVVAALQAGETDRAAAILEQLETWRANLSSTLSEAKAQTQNNPELAEALEAIRNLRSELDALKAPPKPSASPTPSDPPPPTPSPTPTPTPPSDGSPMERPGNVAREEPPEPEAPPVRESPRQKRRGI